MASLAASKLKCSTSYLAVLDAYLAPERAVGGATGGIRLYEDTLLDEVVREHARGGTLLDAARAVAARRGVLP